MNLSLHDKNLTLHSDNKEFYKGLSEFQKTKVLKKCQHMLKALGVVSKAHEEKMSTTWRESWIQACDYLLSKHSDRTVEFWFKAHTENNSKLPTSKEDVHAATKDYNLFLEIEDEETEKLCRDN